MQAHTTMAGCSTQAMQGLAVVSETDTPEILKNYLVLFYKSWKACMYMGAFVIFSDNIKVRDSVAILSNYIRSQGLGMVVESPQSDNSAFRGGLGLRPAHDPGNWCKTALWIVDHVALDQWFKDNTPPPPPPPVPVVVYQQQEPLQRIRYGGY